MEKSALLAACSPSFPEMPTPTLAAWHQEWRAAHLDHRNVIGPVSDGEGDLPVGEALHQLHDVCLLAGADPAADDGLTAGERWWSGGHLTPSLANSSLASLSSNTIPMVRPSITTAFSLSCKGK